MWRLEVHHLRAHLSLRKVTSIGNEERGDAGGMKKNAMMLAQASHTRRADSTGAMPLGPLPASCGLFVLHHELLVVDQVGVSRSLPASPESGACRHHCRSRRPSAPLHRTGPISRGCAARSARPLPGRCRPGNDPARSGSRAESAIGDPLAACRERGLVSCIMSFGACAMRAFCASSM